MALNLLCIDIYYLFKMFAAYLGDSDLGGVEAGGGDTDMEFLGDS